ncbi:MAG: TonB-dependent receptor [Pseudomonadota bacterium]
MKKLVKTTVATACLMAVTPGESTAQDALPVSIPAQPLAEAIAELGRETGLQVGVSRALTEGKVSKAVSGVMSSRQALSRLLEGSGLTIRSLGDDGFTIRTAQVVSQDSTNEPFDLGTIVLQGERVERDVFNTASSVAAFDGETIESNPQFNDLEAVFSNVPNIVTGTGNTSSTIRGISSAGPLSGGALGTLAGNFPRTAITIDGRNLSPNEAIYGTTSVFDTEAIEVFRGPQTTSQGANAIAGAINLRTRDPIFEFEAAFRAELASRNGKAASVMINTPLSDSVAMRFVYDYEEQDNYFDFVAAPGSGVDIGNVVEDIATKVRQEVARLKILIEPVAMPQLTTQFTLSFSEFSAPQNQFLTPPFENLQFELDVGEGINTFVGETTAIVHDLRYDFGSGFSLRNQIQYSKVDTIGTTATGTADDGISDEVDKSLETLLEYAPDSGPLSGILGVYFRETKNDSVPTLVILEGKRQERAIFGEFTYDFANRFDVTAGFRYQENEQTRFAAQVLGPGFIFPLLEYEADFNAFLPKLTFGYEPNRNTRYALQISRGYNPGGGAVVLTSLEPYIFEEEHVTNVELSVRYRSADGRLFLAANLFYNEYDDYQLFVSNIVPPVPPFFQVQAGRVFNLDDVKTYGLELIAEYEARDDLGLFGSVGLLQTDVGTLGADVAALTGSTSDDGNELPLAPNVTMSIGADYQATDRLSIGAQIRYTGSYFSGIANDPTTQVGDYFEADLRAAYEINKNVEVYGYINNVFDERGPISVFRDINTGLITSGSIVEPREFGVGIRATF